MPDEEARTYIPWTEAGGPNECKHGYAAGIPCPDCDAAPAPQPPAPAMRVDDARAERIRSFTEYYGTGAGWVFDLLHDRAEMLAELARLREVERLREPDPNNTSDED